VIIEFLGIKKGPLEEPAYRAWVLSPDGYTILPMRVPTTRMLAVRFFMGRSVSHKVYARQRFSRRVETARNPGHAAKRDPEARQAETSY
jgi:hypothetical protein